MATPRRELSYGSVQIYDKEVLGIGSYGKVFKAKCGQLPCAAKLLHDTLFQDNDPGTRNFVTKFLQECQFLSTIKHPNIVQYLGTATDPQSQRPVLLMELMDESLTRFLERFTGPLPYHSQLNICHDVALALAYLHKLDCFSHGVLVLQIITRNFPNPGEATRCVEDPRFPTGRVSIHCPEAERRKKDIDLTEPFHPLALHCLKDRDTERPSADELCGRLASLKREPRYTHSVEQTRGHVQRLQDLINTRDELESERAEHQRSNEVLRSVKEHLQREQSLVQ